MLLPFDPLSPRALSLTLLVLIILVTVADSGPRASSFVGNDSRYVNCYGADASDKFHCRNAGRNSIAGGTLNVGKSF